MELTLDSDIFEELKTNFNMMLNKLLGEMVETNTPEAVLTAKVTVTLDDVVKGGDMVKTPHFQHKVISAMSIKDSVDGTIAVPMYIVKTQRGVFEMRSLYGDLFPEKEIEGAGV